MLGTPSSASTISCADVLHDDLALEDVDELEPPGPHLRGGARVELVDDGLVLRVRRPADDPDPVAR